MVSETIELRGHIIDSLILPKVLDQILTHGANFKIGEIKIGERRADQSFARIEVSAETSDALDELMLRFSFMDRTLGESHSISLLQQMIEQISGYIPSLREYLEAHAPEMPMSGRLSLECGVYGYEAQVKWARAALSTYEARKEGKS